MTYLKRAHLPPASPLLDPDTDERLLALMAADDGSSGTVFERAETPRAAQDRRASAQRAQRERAAQVEAENERIDRARFLESQMRMEARTVQLIAEQGVR